MTLEELMAAYTGPEVVQAQERAPDALQAMDPLLGMIPLAKGSSAVGQGLMALQGLTSVGSAEAAPSAATIASMLANFLKRPDDARALMKFADHDTSGLLKVATDKDLVGQARLRQAQRAAARPGTNIPDPAAAQRDFWLRQMEDQGGLSALRAIHGR